MAKVQLAFRDELDGPGFKWARPDQFHLTLKFLGDVAVESVPPLTAALRPAVAAVRGLQIVSRGVGCFPGLQRPRVVWFGLSDPAGQLPLLEEGVTQATAPFTAEAKKERFVGHITFCRIQNFKHSHKQVLAGLCGRFAQTEFGAWQVREVLLMLSELSPQGARHTILEQFSLSGTAGSP